jgi:hypothetical protein
VNFKIKTLSLAIGVSISTLAVPSYALPINVQSTSQIKFGPNVIKSDGPNSWVYSETSSSGLNTSLYGYGKAQVDPLGNSNIIALASDTSLDITSIVHQTAQITNSTGTAQSLSFNFVIPETLLSTTIMYSWQPLTSGYYENASYNANILLNGASIWNSAANLHFDATGINLTSTGTNLGLSLDTNLLWMTGETYRSSQYNGLLDLGTINTGSSFTLEYILSVTATTNTDMNELQALAGYGATAKFGDPFTFNNTPFFTEESFIANNNSSSAPEPSGLVLIGSGLAALAFRRKTRKK